MRYFELRQLPNFALATPMFVLSCKGIGHYVMAEPTRFLSLGFQCGRPSAATASQKKHGGSLLSSEVGRFSTAPYSSHAYGANPKLLPHIYLWTFFVVVALLTMHVQVSMRYYACPRVPGGAITPHRSHRWPQDLLAAILWYIGLLQIDGVSKHD